MVTYKHVTEVVRNRFVNHLAKRVDSRAILLLIATSVEALIIWIIKQTNANTYIKQTNSTNKTVHISFGFSISLTIEEWASNYF